MVQQDRKELLKVRTGLDINDNEKKIRPETAKAIH
jgi:hypothetical protein